MIISYLKTALVLALASSSGYLLYSNNQLQEKIIAKNKVEQEQAEEITILNLVKKSDDLEIKKLLAQLSIEKKLANQYQNKLSEIEQNKTEFNRNLSTLENTHEDIKHWLDIEHSPDINRLLNHAENGNKNGSHHQNSKASHTAELSTQ
jgi:hypothetical protein